MPKSPYAWTLEVLAITGLIAATALAITRPLEVTMPAYLELADQLRHGPLERSFEPLGYPWLIARMHFASAPASVKALHLLSYAALAGLTIAVSRGIAVSSPLAACIGSAAVLLHPYVLINIVRVNDNGVGVPLLFSVWALARAASAPAVIGGLLGVLVAVRPNAITLWPLIVLGFNVGHRWRALRVSLAALAVVHIGLSLAMSGILSSRPTNGGYNLFAGNNPFSLSSLVAEYNAEPSLGAGLAWCGVVGLPKAIDDATYARCTLRFVRSEPLLWLRTTVYKVYNLMFRPNLRRASGWLETLVQVLIVVPAVAWVALTVLILARTGRLPDPVSAIVVTAYVVPFVVTNSDPRFRLPLEPILIMSLAATLGSRAGQTTRVEPVDGAATPG